MEPATVKLLPTKARLRQLIRAHGQSWTLLDEQLIQASGSVRSAVFIQSQDREIARWVKPTDIDWRM